MNVDKNVGNLVAMEDLVFDHSFAPNRNFFRPLGDKAQRDEQEDTFDLFCVE